MNHSLGLFDSDLSLHLPAVLVYHAGKQAELEYTKLDAGFVLDLFLEGGGKFSKALVGHHMEHIDVLVLDALAVLVHAQAQTTPHLLAASKDRFLINESADLEYIWVVPALPQG